MYEQDPARAEQTLDIVQAQTLLGYESAPLSPEQLEPGMFDERRAILEDAIRARDALRDKYAAAAVAAGIEINPVELAGWQPSEADVSVIRQQLAPLRRRARMLDGMEEFIVDQRMTANAHGTPLRDHQQDMVIASSRFAALAPRTYRKGGKGGHIGGPPGVGKTGVVNTICSMAKYNEDPEDPLRFVVILDTINTMNQTEGADGARGFGRFAPHLDVGLRYQHSHDTSHHITLMPAASAMLLLTQGEMPDADVVVFDEVDAYARGDQLELFRDYISNKIAYGLSASIDDLSRDLLPYEIYNMSLLEGIKKGLLADTTAEVLRVTYDETALEDAGKGGREGVKLRARIEDMKKRVIQDIKAGRGVLVRVPAGATAEDDIAIAKMVAGELREISVALSNEGQASGVFKTYARKIRALAIGGRDQSTTTGRRFQKMAFDRFEIKGDSEDKIDVFVFVRALERAWDSYAATVLYDLDTGGNWRTKLQVYGRVTRWFLGKMAYIKNYFDPDRPDQFTGVVALGGEPGQDRVTILKDAPDIMPEKRFARGGGGQERSATLRVPGFIGAVAAEVIDHQTVTADETPTDPDQPQMEQQEPPERMSIEQVAEYVGVPLGRLREIYGECGVSVDETLRFEDLDLIVEMCYPPQITELPARTDEISSADESSLAIDEVAARLGIATGRLKELYGLWGFDPSIALRPDDVDVVREFYRLYQDAPEEVSAANEPTSVPLATPEVSRSDEVIPSVVPRDTTPASEGRILAAWRWALGAIRANRGS